ncbi:MAG: YeeE/YedE thiosulfate transporter family protein [Dethiosulfovibrio sp.]|nr:YeeE/YedE thiosulfate transporter family protein [Dethiosulfovibrio sp.]
MYSFEKGQRALNPYIAGAITGVLSVVSVFLTGKFFGASTTFARLGAAVYGAVAPERAVTLEYFIKYPFKADWQFLFLIGIFLGALLSSTLNGTFFIEGVPELWREKFGARLWPRLSIAFLGGIVAAFGARMAGGCPSGHGLSGLMQLSVSGVVSLVAFFIGGVAMARIIYGRS